MLVKIFLFLFKNYKTSSELLNENLKIKKKF